MQELKAVLFDMDGTLIDSEWFYFKAWKKALAAHGFELDSEEWLESLAGKTDLQSMEVLQTQFGFQLDQEAFLADVKVHIAQQYNEETVPLMPGAKELLSFLSKQEITLAVVTSSKREAATYHLEHNGVLAYFKLLITRTEVTHTKPNPEPYNLCVQQLGLERRNCLVLEDSVTGALAAKAAGLTCYGVQSHEIIRSALVVDRSFDNLHQVLEFLERKPFVEGFALDDKDI